MRFMAYGSWHKVHGIKIMKIKVLPLVFLCLLTLCHPLVSAENKIPQQDQNQEPSPAPKVSDEAPSGSQTASDKQSSKNKPSENDFTRFIPTEDISADNAVAFPVDI